MFESICMTIAGIVSGIIIGSLVTLYFKSKGIYIAGTQDILKQYGIPDRLYPRLSLISASAGPLIVFLITFVSSVFPALRLRKLKPVEALAKG